LSIKDSQLFLNDYLINSSLIFPALTRKANTFIVANFFVVYYYYVAQWRRQKFQSGASSPFLYPTLSPFVLSLLTPLSFTPFLPFCALLFSPLSLPLEVGPPKIQLRGLGSAVSSRRDLGRSPNRNRIWCILALKDKIWW